MEEIWARLASSSWGEIRIVKSMHDQYAASSKLYIHYRYSLLLLVLIFTFPAKLYSTWVLWEYA